MEGSRKRKSLSPDIADSAPGSGPEADKELKEQVHFAVPGCSTTHGKRELELKPATSVTPTSSSSEGSEIAKKPSAAEICLQNPLILDKIAKWTSVKPLLSHRTVCPLWNQVFKPSVREKHTPIRIYSADFETQSDKAVNMRKYSLLFNSNSAQIPFAKYEIDIEACPRRLDFFTLYGHTISSLSIRAHYNSNSGRNVYIDMLREIIFQHTPQLKNLELSVSVGNTGNTDNGSPAQGTELLPLPRLPSLKLKSLEFEGFGHDKQVSQLLNDIISAAEELESLALSHLGPGNGKLEIVSSFRDFAPHLEKVKEMKISEITPADLHVLTELARRKKNALQIRKLTFAIVYRRGLGPEIVDAFHTFLAAHSDSLRQLEIRGTPSSVDVNHLMPVRIPQMEHLRSFAVMPDGLNQLAIQFDAGTLDENFPDLKRFGYEINRDEDELDLVSLTGDSDALRLPHGGVTDLKFNISTSSHITLSQLGQFYPSVTHADLLLNGNVDRWSVIWTTWPSLQTLQLQFMVEANGDVLELDQLLSGVPMMQFPALKEELGLELTAKEGQITQEKLRQLWRKYRALPALGDLRQLKKLSIKVKSASVVQDFNISDIGGYFGLAMANSGLQRLTINVPNRHNNNRKPEFAQGNTLSAKCREMIRGALGPYSVVEIN